jgi:hypothetical protein
LQLLVVGQFQHRPHNRTMTILLLPKILVIVIGAWFVCICLAVGFPAL